MRFIERYFINKEKKTVICKLEDCCSELIFDMCEKGYPSHVAMMIEDVFVGKAKCSPEDAFDVEVGKKIAYGRAIAKMCKAKKRALIDFVDGNKKFIEELEKDSNKLIRRYDATIDRKLSLPE